MFNVPITKVEPKDNLILIVTFADGEVVSFDIKTLFDKYPYFKSLEDRTLFKTVKIDNYFADALIWNDDIDLAASGIYFNGDHIAKVEPMPNKLIGGRIDIIRNKRKMSQRDLAKKSAVMQAEISKIERGEGNPTVATLQKLATALNVSIKDFFKDFK